MLSFYPGPSKVYPQTLGFIQEAYEQGIVSINHRSARFERLLKETLENLHQKWDIPSEYTIYFISSATEAWEIVAESLIEQKSMHLYNGAFGKKWSHYVAQIIPQAQSKEFALNESLVECAESITPQQKSSIDTLCLVQSETSNGTGQVINRKDLGFSDDCLIAVDATSSMGGIQLPWSEADVWLASCQKCMGIPAGLGVLICSPKALARAEKLQHKGHYNSILLMEQNRKLFQTHYTPNVLGIYLLNRLSQTLPSIQEIQQSTLEKMAIWEDFWQHQSQFQFDFLIDKKELRLPTVLALQGEASEVHRILRLAEQNHVDLGKGYGVWKENTFRIANFPSHTLEDIHSLIQIIQA
ncbi:aminotransferase class V-fold PLP-dependent enzyme [Aquirufa rosea]|uniref:Alanine--glyoxylate aminotransferase family protein n=1 Tax=Aquirufa rosea TaxID=2509241 RepID=A0A4Q1BXJ7_9BACT|nr:aminotransferase class V-fold PLP-dependent enzyme [Aquirufa rosea]RXK47103.1 alanine--glyoxylate aminotransferase family protein [Aquirufa rosea]